MEYVAAPGIHRIEHQKTALTGASYHGTYSTGASYRRPWLEHIHCYVRESELQLFCFVLFSIRVHVTKNIYLVKQTS